MLHLVWLAVGRATTRTCVLDEEGELEFRPPRPSATATRRGGGGCFHSARFVISVSALRPLLAHRPLQKQLVLVLPKPTHARLVLQQERI